jgi:hypothetical protein
MLPARYRHSGFARLAVVQCLVAKCDRKAIGLATRPTLNRRFRAPLTPMTD